MGNEIYKLLNEDIASQRDCQFCNESNLNPGKVTGYGAIIIYKIGNSMENGWFAALSPRTGGNPKQDFTIQLMPFAHLTHFSQMNENSAKYFGIAFAKLSDAISRIMAKNPALKAMVDDRDNGI